MSIWKNVDPVGAIADFRTVFQQAGKNRWWIALAAAAATTAIFSVMFQEEHRILQRPPKVTYITSWRADRSDAEIVASNRANQVYQEKLSAEQARREAEVREIYKKIGRYSGMDVDAIEAKAKADQAAEDAKLVAFPGKPQVPATPTSPQGQRENP
ncbi:MAG: hypothetical protein ABIQ81_02605 [Novosphingobium sp.]